MARTAWVEGPMLSPKTGADLHRRMGAWVDGSNDQLRRVPFRLKM
jgi:hypothetical protein